MHTSSPPPLQVFLGYGVDDSGVCPIALHPSFGRAAYPVSFFTAAPYAALRAAVDGACTLATSPPPAPLLRVRGLSVAAQPGAMSGAGGEEGCASPLDGEAWVLEGVCSVHAEPHVGLRRGWRSDASPDRSAPWLQPQTSALSEAAGEVCGLQESVAKDMLFSHLSFDVARGQHTLIRGPAGSGEPVGFGVGGGGWRETC